MKNAVESAISFFTKSSDSFFVARSENEQLHVIVTSTGCVVIYARYSDPYMTLDASNSNDWSNSKKVIIVDGEPTPFFGNLIISRSQVVSIVRAFCASGELWPSVFWLREGTEPR